MVIKQTTMPICSKAEVWASVTLCYSNILSGCQVQWLGNLCCQDHSRLKLVFLPFFHSPMIFPTAPLRHPCSSNRKNNHSTKAQTHTKNQPRLLQYQDTIKLKLEETHYLRGVSFRFMLHLHDLHHVKVNRFTWFSDRQNRINYSLK